MDWLLNTELMTDTQITTYIATHKILLFTIAPWVIAKVAAIAAVWAPNNKIRELFQGKWSGRKVIGKGEPLEVIK